LRQLYDALRELVRCADQLLEHREGRIDDLAAGAILAHVGEGPVDGVDELPDGLER